MQNATDTTNSVIDETTLDDETLDDETLDDGTVVDESPEGGIGASLNVDVDVLGIVNKIQSALQDPQDRASFVKNLMESTYYAAGQRYNVMVFNLGQNYQDQFTNVVFYGSAAYNGLTFGVWAFDSGTFVNQGDGGFINWSFEGVFDRNGNTVTFRKG